MFDSLLRTLQEIGWKAVPLWASLRSGFLSSHPQVWWSLAQSSPQVKNCRGQVGGPNRHLSCSPHNPRRNRKGLILWSCDHTMSHDHMCVFLLLCGTCILISWGMVRCCIQGWTSASSSFCSWLNQGWRGWSTRSFSLSSAKTRLWSLWRQKENQFRTFRVY